VMASLPGLYGKRLGSTSAQSPRFCVQTPTYPSGCSATTFPPPSRLSMTPNFFGYLQHELELFGLVLERNGIPRIIAREAALRA
jgi:hypothetical protein